MLACRSDRVTAWGVMVDDTQDMENKTHHRVQEFDWRDTSNNRHNQTRMAGKVLRQLANVSRPLRPRTTRSCQRETVTFRYAFHVAEVLMDIQNTYKTRTEYGIDSADVLQSLAVVPQKDPCRHPAARAPAAFFNLPWGHLDYTTSSTPTSTAGDGGKPSTIAPDGLRDPLTVFCGTGGQIHVSSWTRSQGHLRPSDAIC